MDKIEQYLLHNEEEELYRARQWAKKMGLGRLTPLPKKLIWLTTPTGKTWLKNT